MNIPGTLKGNWRWRLKPMKLEKPARELGLLAKAFGRKTDERKSP
jgi:4-alpha-glucanotransferase